MLSLEEAIIHCKEKVAELEAQYESNSEQLGYSEKFYDCKECAAEHEQLGNWLIELRNNRNAISQIKEWIDSVNKCDHCTYVEAVAEIEKIINQCEACSGLHINMT